MLCNRCLPFLCLQKRQKKKSHISRNEVRNSFLKQKLFRKGGLKKNAPRRRLSRAVEAQTMRWGNWPPHPHLTEDTPHHSRVREHQKPRYTPTVSVPQVPQKRSADSFRSFRPLRSCAVGNAEDVRLRFYRQFRLCFTTTDFGGCKGIGLSTYPYAVGVTSFDYERNITTVLAPSYHVAARQHITSRLRDISLLSERI